MTPTNHNTFQSLEEELVALENMAESAILQYYGTPSQEIATQAIIDWWKEEYSQDEIDQALAFVEEVKNEQY